MKSILTAVLLASCAWGDPGVEYVNLPAPTNVWVPGDVTNTGHFTSSEGITNIPDGNFAARFHDGQGGVIVIPELPVTNWMYVSGIATNQLPYSIEGMRERGILTNTVKTLAEAGEICAVYGHMFRDGRPRESDHGLYARLNTVTRWFALPVPLRYADISHGTGYRTCRICEKVEKQ